MANRNHDIPPRQPATIEAMLIAAAQLIVQQLRADASQIDASRAWLEEFQGTHAQNCPCGLTLAQVAVRDICILAPPYEQQCFNRELNKRARKN